MRLEITALAEKELDDAIVWYRNQQAGTEQTFLAEFRSAVRRICAQPGLYTEIRPNIRRALLHRFPYSLIYEQFDDVLRVLAVAHQHRQPLYWADRSG